MNYSIKIDKLIQPFKFDKKVVENILDKENEGMLKVGSLILIRSSIEPNYEHCFQVLCYNDKETITLGYLYWGSHNTMLRDIYFKVLNKRLYDSKVKLEDISNTLGLTISKLPNVDIAVDFNQNVIEKIYSLFEKPNLEIILLNKVRDKDEYIKELTNYGKGSFIQPYKYKGFTIKARDGHRLELNAYDKTLEIETESPHKEYIRKIEGFTDIWRLEVRANSHQLNKTLKSLGISLKGFMGNIHDSSMQLKIWEHLFNRILRFRTYGKRECERILDLLCAGKSEPQQKAFSRANMRPRKPFKRNKRTRQ